VKERDAMNDIFDDLDKYVTTVRDAACVERTMEKCCGHLSALIKNGRVRRRFSSVAQKAAANQQWLSQRLSGLQAAGPVNCAECKSCQLNPDNFSVHGAVKFGLELSALAINNYKELTGLAANPEERRLFQSFLKGKIKARDLLSKENEFTHEPAAAVDVIDSFCIPNISKLIK